MNGGFLSPEKFRLLSREVHLFLEVLDARAPIATRGEEIAGPWLKGRPRVAALTKADVANPKTTKAWQGYFLEVENVRAYPFSKHDRHFISRMLKDLNEWRDMRKPNRLVKVLVVGVPNVGKSSLVNALCGMKKARVGDEPGITKGPQWIRLSPQLLLLDSPGMLNPDLDSVRQTRMLAALGCLPQGTYDAEEVAIWLLAQLKRLEAPKKAWDALKLESPEPEESELLTLSAKRHHFVRPGGEPDLKRAADHVLFQFKKGHLGAISLEAPPR